MRDPLVIGVDAGATATRCALSEFDGTILARSEAGGANRNSSGAPPAETLAAALRTLLAQCPESIGRIALGVVGLAGAAARMAEARAAAEAAWRAAGLPGRVVVVTDLEVGFAAGTPAPDGLLLLAGTGAVAAAFAGTRLTHRCDGYGWLLGDEGSAVWIGREALRAVMRALDGRGPATALTDAMCAALGASGDSPEARAQAVLRATFDRPPAALGALAPAVSDLAAAGDPVAAGIAEASAVHLLHTLATVGARAGLRDPAVVLAGSVLLSPGPVAERVRAAVRQRYRTVSKPARYGPAGALWLAIAQVSGAAADPSVHARLTR
ncbi:N-acetylglucosamine kinase [Dactylosporangium sp. CA-233914]|uniref:N-acetylglucosamine kinase n=1 Tax=Dactylosporangium sp. CA-233914 TaxID=3239934 RepID=UPI003D8A8FCD